MIGVVACFALQTSSAEALPGAAQGANPTVVRLDEEHHPQPPETSTASHKGRHNNPGIWIPSMIWPNDDTCSSRLGFRFLFPFSEAAGAGRASRAAEGASALGAERAEGSAGAAAERLREDAEQQPGLGHVVGEVRLWQRWVVLSPAPVAVMPKVTVCSDYFDHSFCEQKCFRNVRIFYESTFRASWLLPQLAFEQRVIH